MVKPGRPSLLSRWTTDHGAADARVYRCPIDREIVQVIPYEVHEPGETETLTCSNGHQIKVPRYRGRLSLAGETSSTSVVQAA